MYDTNDSNTHIHVTPALPTDTERIAALQAEATTLRFESDNYKRYFEQVTKNHNNLSNAVQELANAQAEADEDLLDSDEWQAIFDLYGCSVTDPRTCDVTLVITATRTETATVTVTLTGVKKSDIEDIDVGDDGITELGNRRDWAAYLTVGIDYEDMEVSIDDHEGHTEIDDVNVSTD